MQSVISSAPMEEKTMTFIGLFMPCIYNRIVIIRVNNIFVKIKHFIRRKLILIELYTYGTLPTFSKPNLTKDNHNYRFIFKKIMHTHAIENNLISDFLVNDF